MDQLNAGHRITLARPVAVGVPGSEASQVPELAAPGPVPGRQGFHPVIALTGQAALATDTNLLWQHGRLAVRARCYGSGRLRLTWELRSPHHVLALPAAARPKRTVLGTIACDDRVHELVTAMRLVSRHPHASIIIAAGRMTSYRVVVGTVR